MIKKYLIVFISFIALLFSCRQTAVNPEELEGSLSSNTNLLNIGFSADVDNFSFDKTKEAYSVRLKDINTGKIKVTAVAEDKNASVDVEPAEETPVKQGGKAVFKIKVTAKNGSSKIYTVTVSRSKADGESSSNAYLKSLTVTKGILNPAFDKNKTDGYTVSLEFEEENTVFLAVPEEENASVAITETPAGKVAGGGEKSVTVTVTAPDGVEKKAYSFKVQRKNDGETPELLDIILSAGKLTPSFSSAITEYTCTTDYETDKITVRGIPLSKNAQVTVTPPGEQALTAGVEKVFTLKVSLGSSAEKIYTVKVMRPQQKNGNAKLSSLSLKDEYGETFVLSPVFSPDEKNYSVQIPLNKDGRLIASAVPQETAASIAGIFVSPPVLPPEAGSRQILNIIVAAEAGNTETYTITAERSSSGDFSNDASLKKLELKDISGADIALSPSFSSGHYLYSAEVPFVFKKSLKAVYEINHHKAQAAVTAAPEELPAEGGAVQTIAVKVTAEDGSSTQTYTITVKRKPADEVNTLKRLELRLNGTTVTCPITPAFQPDILEYSATVPQSTKYVKLFFEKSSIYSSTDTPTSNSTEDFPFNTSPKILTVKVTSQSGAEKTYKVTVTEEVFDNKFLNMVTVTSTPVTVQGAGTEGVFIEGRTVEIKPFKMGECEITFNSFKYVSDWAVRNGYSFSTKLADLKNGSGAGEENTDQPVTNVTWADVIVWCNAYSKKENKQPVYTAADGTEITKYSQVDDNVKMDRNRSGFRLPTEAEWEFAARGADPNASDWNFRYAGTDIEPPDDFVWHAGSENGTYPGNSKYDGNFATWEPKRKHPTNHNNTGKPQLYDMSGNIAELCWDRFGDIKNDTPAEGNETGKKRVRKGGCSFGFPIKPPMENTQVKKREGIIGIKKADVQSGFRIVCSII